jgi:uncharacterized protein YycO
MKVIFCRSWLPGSLLIRALTFSKWAHVAVVCPDGAVLEATWPHGVRWSTLGALLATHSSFEERTLPITPEAFAWLRAQVGKPYDISALFAVLNPWRDWQEDDKWFCSELIGRATGLFEDASRVSPQTLYLVSKKHA